LTTRFADEKFKVGEDDDGYPIKVKFKHYMRYMHAQDDDSPLYLFQSSFADHPGKQALLQDYVARYT
jgi:histone arginine demethylase JMJD6